MSYSIERLHRIVEQTMQENQIPGAAVLVMKDGEMLVSQGYGKTASDDTGAPVTPETLFRIASVSKLLTGTVLMRLAEAGLLDLDFPITHYIPWFKTSDETATPLITTRMLLSHTSGMPTGDCHPDDRTLEDYIRNTVPTLPVLFRPGTAYSYGNHGLNIAGFVAETVTGKPFAELMQEWLLDPLGMTQTTYDPVRAKQQPLAFPHSRKDGQIVPSDTFSDYAANHPSYYAFSSLQDLEKFARLHLELGAPLMDAASINEMRKEQIPWYTATEAGCGITFFRETKQGVERFWHYGQYSYQYSSQFILVPEKGIAVIALANGENIFNAGYALVDELLGEETTSDTHSLQSEDLSAYTGTFLHSYHGLLELRQTEDGTRLTHGGISYVLERTGTNIYRAVDSDGNVRFSVGFPEDTSCIIVDTKACPAFTEVPSEAADWRDWTGRYSDGEDTYEVSIEDDRLLIRDVNADQTLVGRPITPSQFLTREYGLVNFLSVRGETTIEFDYAWRFPKVSLPVA
ncbi:serine hydrolase domain-containing protein [Exiguobacterium flavidum]|uniref:serine hydrolase domain-containing protein n=1 Tax=Exiguobacterium flavidum TaxID=2184695 RepID=UPI000DF7BE12|nr:serine hydrolase domain-containing protein [Exiguobacterium flavidum]